MSTRNMIADFRKAERHSNARTIIFLVECTLLLTIYLKALSQAPVSASQLTVLSMFGIVYIARLVLMATWLLKRELSVEEITVVTLAWLPSIMASFVLGASHSTNAFQMTLSIIFYVLGSYLNSYSEIERKKWKEIPQHKGRCYTQGLFSLSRNINYFGDTLLFAGWALATGTWWNAWVPITMGSSFWFYHIPDKEKYLQNRYAKEWPDYKRQTPYAFIPFLC